MLRDSYLGCRDALEKGGIENAAFEAQCMLEHLTGLNRASLLAHGSDAFDRQDELDEMIQRRLKNEPLQYILGSWSFMGIELKVGDGVLIPRDDTEVVLNLCLDHLKNIKSAKCADLCSGSGAIALALERYGKAEVTAVELSGKAFYFLEKNINASGVTALRDDVLTCHKQFEDGYFDLIVSNPPYIPSGEISSLQAEVQFEPRMALDGGSDGCDFYRAIISGWKSKLKAGGAMAFELGEGQADIVREMMKGAGFVNIRTETDFGGTHRAIIGTML
ncbi:peptide chain release factor N(5)-glutamine methyltransferase [Lachnoclostridium sp. MSJ-17]|uniref:peptide chain release factor N(5)-glutamine methyltransferase n=1 Tax=Lachnoclostridium sp. MSJ-17 TaxID=2841516 RepID=UPI0020A0C0F1|nr:peptide chain release factor N(5)-glutamine methyltransferase [Lachnoclostridium sp. MSJ-17]MBU5462291.1 peptide chain release factor N(5)-glutamine methyltransferase [Lachnoclostridium sp. MSJ-17]